MRDSTRVTKSGLVLATNQVVVGDITRIMQTAGIGDVKTYQELRFNQRGAKTYEGMDHPGIIAAMISRGYNKRPFYVAVANLSDFGSLQWSSLDPTPNCPLILYNPPSVEIINKTTYQPRGRELDFAGLLMTAICNETPLSPRP